MAAAPYLLLLFLSFASSSYVMEIKYGFKSLGCDAKFGDTCYIGCNWMCFSDGIDGSVVVTSWDSESGLVIANTHTYTYLTGVVSANLYTGESVYNCPYTYSQGIEKFYNCSGYVVGVALGWSACNIIAC